MIPKNNIPSHRICTECGVENTQLTVLGRRHIHLDIDLVQWPPNPATSIAPSGAIKQIIIGFRSLNNSNFLGIVYIQIQRQITEMIVGESKGRLRLPLFKLAIYLNRITSEYSIRFYQKIRLVKSIFSSQIINFHHHISSLQIALHNQILHWPFNSHIPTNRPGFRSCDAG